MQHGSRVRQAKGGKMVIVGFYSVDRIVRDKWEKLSPRKHVGRAERGARARHKEAGSIRSVSCRASTSSLLLVAKLEPVPRAPALRFGVVPSSLQINQRHRQGKGVARVDVRIPH